MAEWIFLIVAFLIFGLTTKLGAFLLGTFLLLSVVGLGYGGSWIVYIIIWGLYYSIKIQSGLDYLPYETLHRLEEKNRKFAVTDEIKDLYLAVNNRMPDEETLQDMMEVLSTCAYMINPKTRRGIRAWLGAVLSAVVYACLPESGLSGPALAAMVMLFFYGVFKLLQSLYDVV